MGHWMRYDMPDENYHSIQAVSNQRVLGLCTNGELVEIYENVERSNAITMPAGLAIAMLQEAIDWIKETTQHG